MRLIQIENDSIRVRLTNYGARIISFEYRSSYNKWIDIVLGHDNLELYHQPHSIYMGAALGRYANRIEGSKFCINGTDFILESNEGQNILHGGSEGYHNQLWDVSEFSSNKCVMTHISAEGSMGFPGKLRTELCFSIHKNVLELKAYTTSSAATHFSFSHHSYFNLNGDLSSSILNHSVKILSNEYLPVNTFMIPLNPTTVEGSCFDFREMKKISENLTLLHPQTDQCKGYDHNYILKPNEEGLAARVLCERSKLQLDVLTNQKGLQFYTNNEMNLFGKANIMVIILLSVWNLKNSPMLQIGRTSLHPYYCLVMLMFLVVNIELVN